MRNLTIILILIFASAGVMMAQDNLQYWRPNDQRGVNVFETKKSDTVAFDHMRVRVGGDFAIQLQGLRQSNDLVGDTLVDLATNFNLPSANLNLDVQIMNGVRMHLRTYLSSRHHNESWVKGGYLQMDNLDFIKPGFLSGLMKVATFRFGMDEINYGDTHFRRSDNARAIYNPFVGNYIMDSFTTEPFGEVTIQSNGFLGVLGVSNGRLNQSPLSGDNGLVVFGKLGYDKQISDDFRFRLTGSFYSSSSKSTRDYLYNGDRAGARYYNVLQGINEASPSAFLPRVNPGFGYETAFQVNPFLKYQGLEFFGVFEVASNGKTSVGGSYTQTGAELLYRFGTNEKLYVGGRFNSVSGKSSDAAKDMSTSRTNFGGGWYVNRNILMKLEYVNQSYSGDGVIGTKFQGASFNGAMVEAVIGF